MSLQKYLCYYHKFLRPTTAIIFFTYLTWCVPSGSGAKKFSYHPPVLDSINFRPLPLVKHHVVQFKKSFYYLNTKSTTINFKVSHLSIQDNLGNKATTIPKIWTRSFQISYFLEIFFPIRGLHKSQREGSATQMLQKMLRCTGGEGVVNKNSKIAQKFSVENFEKH